MKKFIDIYIPTETCNFRCHYCYIAQKRKFNSKLAHFSHSPKEIRQALSKKRLGGVCLLNLCAGGETLLSDEVIPIVKELLEEGHYVMIVTNGSISNRIDELINLPEKLRKHLFLKFSFHYLELKRMKILEKFCDNVEKCKNANISFTIEITPTDELEPYIEEIKKVSIERFGALPHITIARKDEGNIPVLTKHNWEDYINIWKTFDSKLFEYKSQIFGVKRNEFCYAGEWSAYLNLETGKLNQCYRGLTIGNIYENIDKPIDFLAIGNYCKEPHCYNGHVWLALGDIPELDAPKFSEERNRICKDGTEWLSKEFREFISEKLKDENTIYTEKEKKRINLKNFKLRVLKKLKKMIKNK